MKLAPSELEIDRLYEELGHLRLKAARASVVEEETREKLSRLRELQAEAGTGG